MKTQRTNLDISPPAWGLFALALATILASLGMSIATVALPSLAREFAASVSQVQWVVLAYVLSITVAVVSGGRLGDLLGNRPVFLGGLALFSAASVLCALAPTLIALIAARAVQGVGGAIMMALPIAIVRDVVARERTGAAMGLLGSMSAVGTALGPSLGGLLIAWSGWRMAFLALAAVGFGAAIIAAYSFSSAEGRKADGHIAMDVPGTLVLALTLMAFSLAVTSGADGLSSRRALLLAGSAVGAILFVALELRTDAPLVQPKALRSRMISTSLLMNLIVSAVMMSTLVVGPFYLSFTLGLNEAFVGLVMAVGPLMAALTGIPAGRVTDSLGAARVLTIGLVQMTAGLVCLSVLPHFFGAFGYVLSLMLLTPGFQFFLAANNTAVMMTAEVGQRGMISGLLGLSRNLGFMTGASVIGAVFAAAVGTPEIAVAAPEVIGLAFSATFLLAAALTAIAILISILSRQPWDHRQDRKR